MGIGLIIVMLLAFNLSCSANSFKTPESADYYNGKVYISNIGNLPPDKKDNDGFIAVMNENGKIINPKFTVDLNAPKGISFAFGKLFVADIDSIVVIDPKDGNIIKRISIPNSKFLNDTVFDGRKYIYVSDTEKNEIYRINAENYHVSTYIKSGSFECPNGLAFKNGNLIVGSWASGKILKVDKNKKITVLAKIPGAMIDGVCIYNGNIVFSDFANGKIYMLNNRKIKLIKDKLNSPADISCHGNRLFIPEFNVNKVEVINLR